MIDELSRLMSAFVPGTANANQFTRSSPNQEMYSAFWQEATPNVSPSNTTRRSKALTNEIDAIIHGFASSHELQCICERFRIDHNLYDKNNQLVFSIEHENLGLDQILAEEILKLRDVDSKCNAVFYYQANTDLNDLDWSKFLDIKGQMNRIHSKYFRDSKSDRSLLAITGIPDTIRHKVVYTGYILNANSISNPFTTFCGYGISNNRFTSSSFESAIQQAALNKVANTLGTI